MIRLLLSIGSIAVAVGLLVSGTVAFFSDTESSVGNVFAAGAFDLEIDNESYYNGNVCAVDVNDIDEDQDVAEYVWQGASDYPVAGTSCSTSFVPSNLDEGDGLLFFDFTDVKPGDEGEDTISIHTQNDAWVCLDLTLTADDDVSTTEPERAVDVEEDAGNIFDGELADGIEFFWWADDGDNVYEVGENGITDGVVSLATLDQTFPVALADSENNVWGEEDGTPIPGEETVYIAKAWCLGDLTLTPDAQDGGDLGKNPSVVSGVSCDGDDLGNEFQSDSASLDISFTAIQARNNDDYTCGEPEVRLGSLTVTKVVNGGDAGPEDFTFDVTGPSGPFNDVPSGTTLEGLIAGDYTIVEDGPGGYVASFASCGGTGTVAVTDNNNTQCTVTNTANPGSIRVDKAVSFTDTGAAIGVADFQLYVKRGADPAVLLTDNVFTNGLPPGVYTVSEIYTGGQPITYDAIFSDGCTEIADTGEATITLTPGGSVNCELQNSITVLQNPA